MCYEPTFSDGFLAPRQAFQQLERLSASLVGFASPDRPPRHSPARAAGDRDWAYFEALAASFMTSSK